MKKKLNIFILKRLLLALPSVLIIFNSCIGVSTEIQMNRDGSGRITMEYRISKTLDSLGVLDGNESMPPIPVSRSDWERSVSRISGARLVSHSRRETAQDTIISAVIEFNNPQTMAAVLSASNEMISINFSGQSNSNSFNMIFNNSNARYDADLLTLMQTIFSGYNFSFSFNAPGNSTMTLTDARANAISTPSSAAAVLSGRTVSMSMNTLDVLNQINGLGIRIDW